MKRWPLQAYGVRDQLDRELIVNTYRHSSTLLYFKRAARWFPIIEPILAEAGLPDDFKYLAIIESGLSQVVSPARSIRVLAVYEINGSGLWVEGQWSNR